MTPTSQDSQTPKLPPNKILVALIVLGVLGLVVGGLFLRKPAESPENPGSAASSASEPAATTTNASGNYDLSVDKEGLSKAAVTIRTNKGVIKFRFYSEDAPKTTRRIAELISKKFYDGLIFHRVVPGFVIQGGDPNGTGTGGSGTKLRAEFNKRRHLLGTVAMARAMDPDSADSQFYICLAPQPSLDGQYTVFGQVIEGIEVVQAIEQGDRMVSVSVE
jgi:cyclophilin family peptidyl-prolyl cis-trans isomerase